MARLDHAFKHVFLVVFSVATLFPALWVVKMAFRADQSFATSMNPLPTEFDLSNFAALFGDALFGRQLLNSLFVAALTTAVGVFLACTAAYAFSRFRFPGRRAGLMFLLVTQMFPGTLMTIPLYSLMEMLGLLDALLGLVLVYSTTAIPFCIYMLKGYFDTIPRELEESAIMDGAGPFTLFWRIILPLSRPAIAVTALFSFMTAWNEYILAATFMGDEQAYTLPVKVQSFVGDYTTEWGYFAAGALIVSVPVMALFFALQKHLVGGLTAGSVKG
ncbi:sugar ABC transporter permease [Myxococcota bacterium]|jgi:arabinogalactan oligomer/maltooligosaccharide transport system permease protein|nr:sugar ABC transporter permease [Myxococcota bacterium]